MTLGQWIPQYLRSYKLNTIRPDSYYTLELVVSKIPDSLRAMELCDIKPMHLQEFVNAFGCTASKSYMDKMHVMLNGLFTAAVDNIEEKLQKQLRAILMRGAAFDYMIIFFH